MGTEIEQKFPVREAGLRTLVTENHYLSQGCLSTDPEREVRVLVVDDADAFLTVGRIRSAG